MTMRGEGLGRRAAAGMAGVARQLSTERPVAGRSQAARTGVFKPKACFFWDKPSPAVLVNLLLVAERCVLQDSETPVMLWLLIHRLYFR